MDREIYSKVKREYEIKHDLKLRQAREFETKILKSIHIVAYKKSKCSSLQEALSSY